jgi:hypothetical protein
MLRWMAIGLAIWAVATLAVRITDLFALPPGLSERLILLALLAVPLLAGAFWLLVRHVPRRDRLATAAAIAAPGMVADAIATVFYTQFFPLADPASASAFGALMLWGYAVVLLSGALFSAMPSRP